jgi:hypothetical protein
MIPLDQLLAESQAGKVQALPSLSDLLSESLADTKSAIAAKSARQRLARGGLSAAKREADAQRIREWEAKHEWEDVSNVALFRIYKCGCGSTCEIFEGMYRRQAHRHLKHGAQRHLACEVADAKLPNEVATRTSQTEVCGKCMDAKGWDFTHATEWEC